MNRSLAIFMLAVLATFGVSTRVMAKVGVGEKNASGGFALNYDNNAPLDGLGTLDVAGETELLSYEPASGLCRWLSEAPIGESGGINLYGYAGNGPTDLVPGSWARIHFVCPFVSELSTYLKWL